MTSLPVAVLTNSTLLPRKDTREALLEADLLAPSLDAATQDIFEKINQPCSSLKIKEVIDSLITFRREFKGRLWLEIMLVKGVNDSPAHINRLKEAVSKINPDKVQLNTVVRPPAKKSARPLSPDELEKIKKIFGKNCEIIAEFSKKTQKSLGYNLEGAILDMVQRRPLTLSDISTSLGRNKNEILKCLNLLLEEGKVRAVFHKGLKYFEPK